MSLLSPGRPVAAPPRPPVRPADDPDVAAPPGTHATPTSPSPAGTRPPRDPFVDGVRAIGTVLVVLLHWLMVEATWDGHVLAVGNALAHGPAWLLTWLQPLPLLFFAAGAAARYDLERHPDGWGLRFAGTRVLRMARPVAVLAIVWAGSIAALPLLGVPQAAVDRAARIVPQPLWFLGVQVGLLALTPLLVRALRRWGAARVLVVLAALPVVVDVLRFSDRVPVSGVPNVLLVWALPYVGGLVHAQRRLAPPADRPGALPAGAALALLVTGGLAATVLLLAAGPYPVALIGMPGDAISNLGPPTAPVVGFAVAQVAAALLVHDALARWARRSAVVRWIGARSMGLYLWHLPAVFAVTGVVLVGLDQALPASWSAAWWVTRPVHLGAAALVLVGLVAAASRVERRIPRRPRRA